MPIHSQAPTRVDLAGGTLDLWPLYLFHNNSQTINFAVNYHARCRLTPRRDNTIELISRDLNRRETFSSLHALAQTKKFRLPLLARLVKAFEPRDGFTLETDSDAPAGAGLGGSSALNVAVCGALFRFVGSKLSPSKLIEVARNVEAQVLGVPTGEQDYYSAVYGGIQAVCLRPHGVWADKLAVHPGELSARVVLCYSGQSRNSGINNWEVMKAHVDGNRQVIRQFDRIAALAGEMRQALEERDWQRAAQLLRQDWEARKRNHAGITTNRIEQLTAVARRHGASAAKACGAGGGGCVVFIVEPDAKQRVEIALRRAGAPPLPLQVSVRGLKVSSSG